MAKNRETINKLREQKLKEIRKGGGAGRPSQPKTTITRGELEKMRDIELARVGDYAITIKKKPAKNKKKMKLVGSGPIKIKIKTNPKDKKCSC